MAWKSIGGLVEGLVIAEDLELRAGLAQVFLHVVQHKEEEDQVRVVGQPALAE